MSDSHDIMAISTPLTHITCCTVISTRTGRKPRARRPRWASYETFNHFGHPETRISWIVPTSTHYCSSIFLKEKRSDDDHVHIRNNKQWFTVVDALRNSFSPAPWHFWETNLHNNKLVNESTLGRWCSKNTRVHLLKSMNYATRKISYTYRPSEQRLMGRGNQLKVIPTLHEFAQQIFNSWRDHEGIARVHYASARLVKACQFKTMYGMYGMYGHQIHLNTDTEK